ncbi:methylated-DNA--[protein]-cysteine S-methyltransferase [Candidatus Woesearchaeota archaeon]|nr:methylated-DNA--[protein]-cysteine S-methyltransferase [Candidatus Woesearchaeota archaeon]
MRFQEKVLNLCSKIPKGKVTTYKEIGKALGKKGQVYRAVGRALYDNKFPVKIPCHRVVCSDGSVGGYSRGIRKKIRLLRKEGVEIDKDKIKNFKKKLFRF